MLQALFRRLPNPTRRQRSLKGTTKLIDDNSLETVLALIKQLEAELLELKRMRAYVAKGVEQEMLESVIVDNETKLTEIKRKIIQ